MTDGQRLPTGQTVFDPRGTVTATPVTLAPRLSSRSGVRLAVLDNSKWNASKLLRATVARLEATGPLASVTYYRKDSFSRMAASSLLDEIREASDAVLTAIGD